MQEIMYSKPKLKTIYNVNQRYVVINYHFPDSYGIEGILLPPRTVLDKFEFIMTSSLFLWMDLDVVVVVQGMDGATRMIQDDAIQLPRKNRATT